MLERPHGEVANAFSPANVARSDQGAPKHSTFALLPSYAEVLPFSTNSGADCFEPWNDDGTTQLARYASAARERRATRHLSVKL